MSMTGAGCKGFHFLYNFKNFLIKVNKFNGILTKLLLNFLEKYILKNRLRTGLSGEKQNKEKVKKQKTNRANFKTI